jgi:hypothetical protein
MRKMRQHAPERRRGRRNDRIELVAHERRGVGRGLARRRCRATCRAHTEQTAKLVSNANASQWRERTGARTGCAACAGATGGRGVVRIVRHVSSSTGGGAGLSRRGGVRRLLRRYEQQPAQLAHGLLVHDAGERGALRAAATAGCAARSAGAAAGSAAAAGGHRQRAAVAVAVRHVRGGAEGGRAAGRGRRQRRRHVRRCRAPAQAPAAAGRAARRLASWQR